MAPSIEALENDLRDGVRAIVAEGGWDEVTVNNVRQHVEKKAGLKKGFFKTDDWEARSKKIIKEYVTQLLAEEDEKPTSPSPAATPKTEPKNGIKRHSSDEPSPAPKRQKKASRPTSSKKTKSKKEESESELSDLDDLSELEPPPKKAATKKAAKKEDSDSDLSELSSSEDKPQKPKPKKSAPRRKTKKEETESELSDLDDSEEEPKKKKAKAPKKAAPRRKSKNGVKGDEEEANDLEDPSADKKRKRTASTKKRAVKRAKVESDSEDNLVDEKEEATKDKIESDVDVDVSADTKAESSLEANATRASKAEESDEDTKPKDSVDEDAKAAKVDDSDSELSSVLDEPPPKKRKSKEPKGATKPKQTKELTGDETEIKKLQGQLVKCGIRKIWGIELKKYGDDSKGKIRHLRGMLRDAGMDGRFSEAKAKEIKERRELMADLEAVTEMNRNWGSGGGAGRVSRSKVVKKTLKEDSDHEDDADEGHDDEDEAEDDEDGVKANPRVSKRMADLAFLGDDSESD